MQYLGIEQVTDILRIAYKNSRRDHLLLLLSFSHGLRRSEVARLRVQDVSGGLIRVQRCKGSLRTEQPLMASQNLLFDEPKALSAWLQERRSKTDYLFPSRFDDGHLKIKSASQAAAKVMIDAGIPTELAHHHSLKHALASLMIRSKVDLSFVKQALGHASISSTIHYVHIADSEATEKASQAIQAALS